MDSELIPEDCMNYSEYETLTPFAAGQAVRLLRARAKFS